MTLIGDTISEAFSTGVEGESFTRTASYIDGAAVEWSPTFTEIGDGAYLYTYTPDTAGAHVWLGEAASGMPVIINVQVSTDPLAAVLSGYATNTAGWALRRIGSGLVSVTAPVAASGDVEVVIGDDYLADDGRDLAWSSDSWPNLDGAEIAFVGPDALEGAGSVVESGAGTQQVRVELTSEQTADARKMKSPYAVVATLANGSAVTLVRGTLTMEGRR